MQTVVKDINVIEIEIEKASEPIEQFQKIINEFISGTKNIFLSDRSIDVKTEEGEDIGLVSLSSGEKHLLRIIVENLLAGRNSIIIDEPELSMHVDWQLELLNIMQMLNPTSQIIVATHSPEIMARIPEDKIFRI